MILRFFILVITKMVGSGMILNINKIKQLWKNDPKPVSASPLIDLAHPYHTTRAFKWSKFHERSEITSEI